MRHEIDMIECVPAVYISGKMIDGDGGEMQVYLQVRAFLCAEFSTHSYTCNYVSALLACPFVCFPCFRQRLVIL